MTRIKWPAMKHCNETSVTTSSGKFTFHAYYLSKKEAKKVCKKEGGILAPVTNRADLEALHKFAIGCSNLGYGRYYLVGLEMIDPETRFFTNGVVYDEEIHGSFHYVYNSKGKLPACWNTYMGTYPQSVQGMHTNYNKDCYPTENKFICLNPATVTPSCN